MIDNNTKVVESVLYHNEEDIPMYGATPKECDDVKKLIGEV